MRRSKLAILASTAMGAAFGLGQTADAAPQDFWVGFYAGGNLGYSWGRADTTVTISPFALGAPFNVNFPGASSFIPLRPNGFIGGGQIGYSWFLAPRWLAGIEADLQWSGQKDSKVGRIIGVVPGCYLTVCNFIDTTDVTAKLSWFGTVRGRVGVVSNNVVYYGTIGAAFGKVSVVGTNRLFISNGASTLTILTPFNYSRTKFGWVAGFGMEGVITASNWTWKVEYLHIDLGSIGGGRFGSVPVVTLNTKAFTDDIVRIGLNYQFGAPPSP